MKVGFTGTCVGMTAAQLATLQSLLDQFALMELHHGDCVGADDEAASLTSACLSEVRIVCHPSVDELLRAHNVCHHEIRAPQTYFARNRAIVDETECLIACPGEPEEQPRGGTWQTVRYARRRGKRVVIVWPDGSVKETGA